MGFCLQRQQGEHALFPFDLSGFQRQQEQRALFPFDLSGFQPHLLHLLPDLQVQQPLPSRNKFTTAEINDLIRMLMFLELRNSQLHMEKELYKQVMKLVYRLDLPAQVSGGESAVFERTPENSMHVEYHMKSFADDCCNQLCPAG